MRSVFIISYIANVLLALVALALLPERVAIHFGLGGRPDNWASSYANTLIFLGVDTFLFLVLYYSTRLASKIPPMWINLPNKPYWLAPENRARFQAKISGLMYPFGTALFVFLFVAGLLSIQANLADPVRLNERPLFVFLGLFVAYALAWGLVFFRSFRIPE